jgi:hypothetical protein
MAGAKFGGRHLDNLGPDVQPESEMLLARLKRCLPPNSSPQLNKVM